MAQATKALVREVRTEGQDFEFYPTTDEIIQAAAVDMNDYKVKVDHLWQSHWSHRRLHSLLDIGAGNGKVIRALRDKTGMTDCFAIEKSLILCKHLVPDIFIIGTDLFGQSLLDKSMDVTFCNPPYSDYERWVCKIIQESNSIVLYFVIPVRWKTNTAIAAMMKYRGATSEVVGTYSFVDSEDRKARAKVDLVRMMFEERTDDAFSQFFEAEFSHLKTKMEAPEEKKTEEETDNRFSSLVKRKDYLLALVELYQEELTRIQDNYKAVAELDPGLLREFDISIESMLKLLRNKLTHLKSLYWNELFSRLDTITNRLTSKNRDGLLKTLNENGHVDFTAENVGAILIWVISQANEYADSQVMDLFNTLAESANVKRYKSNQIPLIKNKWRYRDAKATHIALEYRLVLEYVGGVRKTEYIFESGLEESAATLLQDLLTVAHNMGFECDTAPLALVHRDHRLDWEPGKRREFYCVHKGKRVILFDVRGFMNRNMHIRLNQQFALALNVEHGRLSGWVHSGEQAAEELEDAEAAQYFGSQILIGSGEVPFALPAHEPPKRRRRRIVKPRAKGEVNEKAVLQKEETSV